MYVAYEQISLHKPHTSRPANSERYIICRGLRKNYSDAIRDYLKRVNLKLDELTKSNSSQDVNSIVPLETLRNDEAFRSYLTGHNEHIASRQSTYLQKYLTYAKNSSLIDKDQDAVFVWKKHWEKLDNNLMRIPDRTVLLVERATTYKLVDKRLETVAAESLVRILDAAVINGDDVSGLVYSKRLQAAKKFCLALKLVRRRFSRLRHSGEEVLIYEEHGNLLMCKALRVARLLKESWKMGWSCSRQMLYAFNPHRPDLGSFFEPQWEEYVLAPSFFFHRCSYFVWRNFDFMGFDISEHVANDPCTVRFSMRET
ncbi:unnamed protein product [Cylicostephanus goldi]|uniref:Cap-specific mRNA (nucleoside-2'-O-)-methyltransferase 1 n=1 Tax=Cylicostephanus goldi TaxID=71465 RepID=A0A3P7MB76_CYLGO|nr:unnamed protein product [Cylicostephanus goldi]